MKTTKIRKLLIANRGEIAVRIIRTCRELGIETVAVFSEADRTAPHVRLADEAYAIGPPEPEASYLNIGQLLEAAQKCGADSVHPGYGFLSENAAFAEACEKSGLRFIGPPSEVIRLMGDKSAARSHMQAAGVPVVPGTEHDLDDNTEAGDIADQIGYPVLIKASAGGGGKGMRVVEAPRDLERAITAARSEAGTAFGDSRIFIEKYLHKPRHIEFQILADSHGNIVHLFERECSIQRRHQKVIEEAPSAALTPELRARMGEAAILAARSSGYVNAGTVEFLLDDHLNFYFIEMNARLQVEHPVTEWITGLDLVAEQLRIAEGEALGYTSDHITMCGHAIECRVFAEDPANHFLPDPGMVLRHHPPAGFGVRLDSGIEEGHDIPIHYDPLIAKLSTWGRSRDEAIRRMKRALHEYEVAGVQTTLPFCRFVMEHEAFRTGQLSTHFVEEHFHPETVETISPDLEKLTALAAVLIRKTRDTSQQTVQDHKRDNHLPGRWVQNRRRW